MEEEKIKEQIEEYKRSYNKFTLEAQAAMQQANELTTRATRLEGAIQALELLLQEEK